MSRPRLQLVHSSNGSLPGALHRQRKRGFRPLVMQGGRAKSAPSSWETGLELFNLGFLASGLGYLAFLQASVTVLEICSRADY